MLAGRVLAELRGIVGPGGMLASPGDLLAYEYDAALERAMPDVVVLPTSTEQVAAVVRLANREGLPFVPRGAGTNLSGGSVPIKGGIVIALSRMNRILEIDIPNERAVVEPGVVNLDLSMALAPHGYYYAPDPASQKVSTIGGNVAENAGGPHCLRYGVTTNHVLGLEVVLPDGEVIETGGKAIDPPGYDLTGLFVGSEGTLGIVTKVIVRILPLPEAVKTLLAIFDTIEDASRSVSAIIAAGLVPATLEMMDKHMIAAVEASLRSGFPIDAEAVLIIELDGLRDELDRQANRIIAICQEHNVREVKAAASEAERNLLWAGRRGAFGAIARVSPSYLVLDGTVPRTSLPEALQRAAEIGRRHGFVVHNVFHAGDGNLHPLIPYDGRDPEQKKRAVQAGMEILETCAALGGTISGEHGIGLEKIKAMPLVFQPADLITMRQIKHTFDPDNLCNPGKVLPAADAAAKTNSAHG